MTVHPLYAQLYDLSHNRNRRSFDASLSRTIHRLEQRGLISRDGDTIVMTQYGRWAIHPEGFQMFLDQMRQSIREAVDQAAAESPELQKAKREVEALEGTWKEIFKSNGWL